MSLRAEILALLAQHGETADVDFPAICILLNTTDGGHYQERFAAEAIAVTLAAMRAAGTVEAHASDAVVSYRLTAAGRAAMTSGEEGDEEL